jgi:hypothetical protein
MAKRTRARIPIPTQCEIYFRDRWLYYLCRRPLIFPAAMLHLDSAMTGQGVKVIAGARSYVASELRFAIHRAKQALQDDASSTLERELASLPSDASGVGPGAAWYRRWEQLSEGGRNMSFQDLGARFTEIRTQQLTALAATLTPRIEAATSPNAITTLLAQQDLLESDQTLAPMVRLGELALDRRELLRALSATGMTEQEYHAEEALGRTQDEPTAGDLYRAMARWFARINAEQTRAVENCSRLNPLARLQALAGSAGTGGTAPMEVWITRFRKRTCVQTEDARIWDCQFEVGFDSNMSVSSTPFGALFRSGAGDTGRGYFGEARYGWEFEPRR